MTNSIEQQVSELATTELKQKIDGVYDSLVVNKPKGKLPENIFQQYFLPFFSGEKDLGQDNKLIEQWISIAGSPMTEVDIVDNAGNVIFTVPSLFDTNIINTVIKDRRTSLTDIYTNSEIRSSRIPVEGTSYLLKALDEKAYSLTSGAKVSESNTVRWNDILNRYGKGNTEIKSNKQDNDSSDDFEY